VDEAFGLLGEESQVVVVQFKAVLGPHSGFMRLFLPATLVGMAHPLEEGPQRRARRAAAVAKHLKRLAGVKTWLRAEIGRCELSTRDLAELRGGDVVLADEISARPDKNEGGKAKLRVGLGRVGRLDADVALQAGRWMAKITGFEFGGAPRETREPSEHEEEAADSLSEEQAGQVDAPAESEQDAREVEESTSPGEKVVDDTLKEGSELLNDIPLQVSVELARIPVTAEEVVSLKIGQVLDLNRVPGEPVDLSVNGKVVARGELVEVEGHLGVRVLSLTG
jgi:flagellar motor switch protein FliM